MINWMQKHKKYLIPTIWISGIAFIGAGFVGWGAYDFNKNRSTSVAKVGNTPISIQEFHQKYGEIYNYFNSLGEKRLTQEEADKMNLDQVALATLIQETMLLNYAKDLGLGSNDEDVLKQIVSSPAFQKDGKFDKNIYLSSIKSLGITPGEYEDSLKKSITLDKLDSALNLPVTQQDKEMIASVYFMADRLSIEVLNQDNNVTFSQDELEKYWQENKNSYMTTKLYVLDTYFLENEDVNATDGELMEFYEKNRSQYRDATDKILSFEDAKDRVYDGYKVELGKSKAVSTYLALKKGEKSTNKQIQVSQDDQNFPLSEITASTKGELIKPFEYNGGNLIAKISDIQEPRVMGFEEAKSAASQDYKSVKMAQELESRAKKSLDKFNGTDIGYIQMGDAKSQEGLSESEFSYFVNQVFSKNEPKGYVVLADKIVVYEITQQRLATPEKIQEDEFLISQGAKNLIDNDLKQDLLKALHKRYKIEQYYKGKNIE